MTDTTISMPHYEDGKLNPFENRPDKHPKE